MTRLKRCWQRLRKRVESAALGQSRTPLFSLETGLQLLAVLYGAVMAIRAHLYAKGVLPIQALPCRVVSIGNIIAGGTGKTPMTIMVAQLIRDLGYRVVVISRGYRGRMETAGGIVSDGKTIFQGPEDAGDEPYLMARILKGIPVVVGKRRYDAGMLAVERFQPHVIVLDDAFQHIRLKRDLNLVLLDSRAPFGNGYLLPRGVLREPVAALRRAHAVILTRSDPVRKSATPDGLPERRPVYHTTHLPVIRRTNPGGGVFLTDTTDISLLTGKRALAFAGLADNAQFFESLELAGCTLVRTLSFSDHHKYSSRDLGRIAEAARETNAEVIVATLKDFVKIESGTPWPVKAVAVDATVALTHDDASFRRMISTALQV
ncbi:tetraacyldisaccharide 4'-kinase [Desulfosarcina sp.]|uniref:tetraacyldisaccharide 4'-kinase n=1 Tax=Desulfosarcina sp. TaxID=2027861 RepID=UPI0039707844